MNKTEKLFKGLALLLGKPSRINLILEDEELYRRKAIKKYGKEAEIQWVRLTDLTGSNTGTADPFSFLEGSSLPTDLWLLRALAERTQASVFFETGTWRGESVAAVAPAVQKCFTLNLSDEDMRSMKLSEAYIKMHRYFSKNLTNVTHLSGNSADFDFTLYEKTADLIFVDGDHHYESVKRDTATAFRLMKDPDSVIVWHDAGEGTESIRWSVMAGILDGCPPGCRANIVRVQHTLCAVYCRLPLQRFTLVRDMEPENYYSVSIQKRNVTNQSFTS